jgi:AcrR family transcriptional regulator
MAAALRLFAERGFAATRLEDVAVAAGVSKGTVYLYFENKEKLFEAVVRDTVTPNIDQIEALVDAFDGSTPNLLRTLGTVVVTALDGPLPAVAKLVIAESGNFPQLARLWGDLVVRRMMGLFQRIVKRGVDRGEFRPVNPADIAPLIAAPVLLVAIWKQSLGRHTDIPLDHRAMLAAHIDMILRGLANSEQVVAEPTGEP